MGKALAGMEKGRASRLCCSSICFTACGEGGGIDSVFVGFVLGVCFVLGGAGLCQVLFYIL